MKFFCVKLSSTISVCVDSSKVQLVVDDGFDITGTESSLNVFSTDFTKLRFPPQSSSLAVKQMKTDRVRYILCFYMGRWSVLLDIRQGTHNMILIIREDMTHC